MSDIQGKKILIVEDDPLISDVLKQFFLHVGAQVYHASNGLEGLHQFNNHQPHLTILDIMMPYLDGQEVCKRIRQSSNTPIIMISALSHEEEIIKALDNGADDYVTKPFLPSVLLARSRAVLRRTGSLRSAPPLITSAQTRKQIQGSLPQPAVESQPESQSEVRIYCLGDLRVERKGQLIEGQAWAGKSKAGRQKVRALLAYLIERGSQGATKDELIEALWGPKTAEYDNVRLEGSLARTLSALRQVLEPDLAPQTVSSVILYEEGHYYLNSTLCWVDAEAFQGLIIEARNAKLRGEPKAVAGTYQKALALYQGDYLRDIPRAEEWAGLQRYALNQKVGIALMGVGDYYLERGDFNAALGYYGRAIEQEPTNETAHYRLIDGLRQEGRFEEAILAYQQCRRIFNQEVDEEPPDSLIDLYKSIQAQFVHQQRSSDNFRRRKAGVISYK